MGDKDLTHVLEALSSLARTGWMLRGVPSQLAESVSEHLFSSALLALEIGLRARDEGVPVDPYRAAAIALVHDLAESLIGDIAKTSGIDKSLAERRAMEALQLHDGVKELYMEYEERRTIEAIIARIAELSATLLRARRYKAQGYPRVEEIEESSRKAIQGLLEGAPPGLREIVRQVVSLQVSLQST